MTGYDMPRRRGRRRWSAMTIIIGVPVFLVIFCGMSALLALLLQWVLTGFGVDVSFGPCFGAIVLAELLFGGSAKS